MRMHGEIVMKRLLDCIGFYDIHSVTYFIINDDSGADPK